MDLLLAGSESLGAGVNSNGRSRDEETHKDGESEREETHCGGVLLCEVEEVVVLFSGSCVWECL